MKKFIKSEKTKEDLIMKKSNKGICFKLYTFTAIMFALSAIACIVKYNAAPNKNIFEALFFVSMTICYASFAHESYKEYKLEKNAN